MPGRNGIGAVLFLCALVVWPASAQQTEIPPEQKPAEEKKVESVRIVFVGDVLMEAKWRNPAPPPGELFAEVREILQAADVAICNLESPLTDWPHQTRLKSKAMIAAGRDYVLRVSSQDAAPALRDAGIDITALANNHTMDYGERGMFQTMERLRDAEVLSVGAGANRNEAERMRIVEVRGMKVGVLSFSDVVPPGFAAKDDWPGIASAKDPARMSEVIRRSRPEADFLVVVFHWGEELAQMPSQRQLDLAKVASEAGADVILGAHPHVLQPVGCSGMTPVVYSAGNFVFPTTRPLAQRSAIFEVEVQRGAEGEAARVVHLRVFPTQMNEVGRARPAPEEISGSILKEMRAGAALLGGKMDGDKFVCTGEPVQYVPPPKPESKKSSPKKRR